MAKRLFSPEAKAIMLQNKNVLRVSDGTITYCPDFKVGAVRANLNEAKPPQSIFVEAGFDLELIGHETPKRCLKRWRAVFKQYGEVGLRNDQRGKHATGRPVERELTVEEKLRRAEAKVRFLQEENELLKKFRAIERGWLKDPRRNTR